MAKTSMSQRKTLGRVMHETARRAEERATRQGRQGKEPAPGDRHRARGGRCLQVRNQEEEPAQPRAHQGQGSNRPHRPAGDWKARPASAPAASARHRARWAARTPRPRRCGARRAGAPRERPPDVFQSVRNGQAIAWLAKPVVPFSAQGGGTPCLPENFDRRFARRLDGPCRRLGIRAGPAGCRYLDRHHHSADARITAVTPRPHRSLASPTAPSRRR